MGSEVRWTGFRMNIRSVEAWSPPSRSIPGWKQGRLGVQGRE